MVSSVIIRGHDSYDFEAHGARQYARQNDRRIDRRNGLRFARFALPAA
jgi:hypothetical protein